MRSPSIGVSGWRMEPQPLWDYGIPVWSSEVGTVYLPGRAAGWSWCQAHTGTLAAGEGPKGAHGGVRGRKRSLPERKKSELKALRASTELRKAGSPLLGLEGHRCCTCKASSVTSGTALPSQPPSSVLPPLGISQNYGTIQELLCLRNSRA